jgi:anti-anti-sigma regulatory factor
MAKIKAKNEKEYLISVERKDVIGENSLNDLKKNILHYMSKDNELIIDLSALNHISQKFYNLLRSISDHALSLHIRMHITNTPDEYDELIENLTKTSEG